MSPVRGICVDRRFSAASELRTFWAIEGQLETQNAFVRKTFVFRNALSVPHPARASPQTIPPDFSHGLEGFSDKATIYDPMRQSTSKVS